MEEPVSLSFEAALKQLEIIVSQLENGDTPLDQAISLYEQGEKLRGLCTERLDAAQTKIEAIRLGADGKPAGTRPFAAG